jgi:hypothetical protein
MLRTVMDMRLTTSRCYLCDATFARPDTDEELSQQQRTGVSALHVYGGNFLGILDIKGM